MRSTSTDAARADLIRVFIAVALAIAAGTIALATFDYAVVAMQVDLHFSAEDGSAAMLVPATSSLVVVFVAGVFGDRLGRRRVMVASAGIFALGALIVALAPSLPVVMAGQVLEGGGGAALAITALAVLSASFTSGRARAFAFGAFSAIMPAVFIGGPIIGSALEQAMNWRAVPLLSLVVGLLAAGAAGLLLPADRPTGSGEMLTPLLAGFVLCGVAGAASALIVAPGGAAVLTLAVVAVTALVGLVVAMRRLPAPSLDLSLLRNPGGSGALLALVLSNAVNLLFFTTLLLQYLMRLSPFDTAVAMMPVQVAGTAGGFAGGWVIARVGVVRAGVATLLVTALAGLGVLIAGAGSPTWLVLAMASLYAFAGFSSVAPLTQRVMDLAPADGAGAASALRTGGAAIGAAVGGVLVAAIAFGIFQTSFTGGLESNGFSAPRADRIAMAVRESASLTGLQPKRFGIPIRDVHEVERRESPSLDDAEITAYQSVGIAAAIANALAALALLVSLRPRLRARRRRTRIVT
ncbi:MAG: MFS transporter [Miltoncostaeaceae bacterium]